MQMSTVFATLPKEVVDHILEYDTTVCYRNGQYINRIPNYDVRYQILKPVPGKFRTSTTMSPNNLLPPQLREISAYIRFDNRNLLLLKQRYAYGKYIHYGFINRGDKYNIKMTDYKMLLPMPDDVM